MPSQPILVHQDAGRKEVQDVLAVDGQCKVLLLLLTNDQKPWGLATGGGGEPLAKLTLMFGERTFPKLDVWVRLLWGIKGSDPKNNMNRLYSRCRISNDANR